VATEKGVFVSINSGNNWKTLTGLRRITGERLLTGSNNAAQGTALLSKGLGESFTFGFQHDGVRSRTTIKVNGAPRTEYILAADNKSIQFTMQLGAGDVVTADYDAASGISSSYPFNAVVADSTTYDPAYSYSGTIYAGTLGNGVWKTVDAGHHWSQIVTMATSGVSFDNNVLTLDLYGTTDLYAGTRSGLFASSNGGQTWSKLTGSTTKPINESVVQDVLVASSGIWIAGKNGVHYSLDSGATWNTPATNVNATDPTNLDARALARDDKNGTLYVATTGDVLQQSNPYGGVYSSADNGVTWSKLTSVSTVAGSHKLDALDVYGQTGNDILVIGSEGRAVWRSADSGTTWSALPGTAPSTMTNTLFTTMSVMHSGITSLALIPQKMTYQPQNDGTTLGYWAKDQYSSIYNTESHTFYLRVADDLGNPLVGGSTISASVTAGILTGDTAVTIPDSVRGSGDYKLTWSNDLTTVSPTDVQATLNIVVTSTNGPDTRSITRTLINPINAQAVAVTDSYSAPNANPYTMITITAQGGSNGANGYKFTAGTGLDCSTTHSANNCTPNTKVITTGANQSSSVSFYYTPLNKAGTLTDTITIQDNVTKQSTGTPISVTITFN